MRSVNQVVDSFQESIFSVITQLANREQAINLAQGFPDFDGPDWVKEMAKAALSRGKNQYAPSYGAVPLREAIARNYSHFYSLQYDPVSEVLVTNGATDAIYSTISALINPGDEAIVFEPVYDSYLASLQLARATIKVVTLKAPDFTFSPAELRAQVSPKTKLLILNNPHNPTGRVFTREELTEIGKLAVEHDFYILSDEVYEFLTFERDHIAIASIADLRDRVITVSSIGKTLSLTGWKIGWACGSAPVIKAIHNMHQFVSFCVAHPLQEAIAEALPRLQDYAPQLRTEYLCRRDLLVEGLLELGFDVLKPEGTYFAIARLKSGKNDVEFCMDLIAKKRVALIPTSIFYVRSEEGKRLVRFCFGKKEETLRKALQFLRG